MEELEPVRPTGLVGRLHNFVQAVAVAMLALYFLLVLIQVFFRYVLNDSVFWAEEVVRDGLIWGVMLGSALVAHQRAHIRIEIVELMLSPGGKNVVYAMVDALTLAFCLILAWTGIEFVQRTWFQNSASLDLPMWIVYVAIPVGAVLQAIFTVDAWRRRRLGEDQTGGHP